MCHQERLKHFRSAVRWQFCGEIGRHVCPASKPLDAFKERVLQGVMFFAWHGEHRAAPIVPDDTPDGLPSPHYKRIQAILAAFNPRRIAFLSRIYRLMAARKGVSDHGRAGQSTDESALALSTAQRAPNRPGEMTGLERSGLKRGDGLVRSSDIACGQANCSSAKLISSDGQWGDRVTHQPSSISTTA